MNDVEKSARRGRERTLVTPEGLALPVVLASRGSRFGGIVLDLLILVLVMVLTTLALGLGAAGLNEVTGEAIDKAKGGTREALQFIVVLWIAVMFLFRHAYFLFFELGPRGATPGKRAVGMRVAARDGGRLTAEMILARNLVRDIELFLPLSFIAQRLSESDWDPTAWAATAWFLLFALFPLFNRDRLRAGDLIAGTWVIEAPRQKLEAAMSTGASAARGTSLTTGAEYRFGEAELAAYGEYELQTLERVLRDDRPEALVAVHEAICRKIGWHPGAGDERAFLDAYYTQLRARLEAGMRMGKRKADKHA
jgi:uncharacterized RDD family membrane protein YckC